MSEDSPTRYLFLTSNLFRNGSLWTAKEKLAYFIERNPTTHSQTTLAHRPSHQLYPTFEKQLWLARHKPGWREVCQNRSGEVGCICHSKWNTSSQIHLVPRPALSNASFQGTIWPLQQLISNPARTILAVQTRNFGFCTVLIRNLKKMFWSEMQRSQ